MGKAKIIWTRTDEAPLLATYSFLPAMKQILKDTDVDIELRDISLAGRILALFKKAEDDLAFLGELVNKPEANIVKLPNISASIPQLIDAVKELQSKGFDLPDFPEEPKNDEEQKIRDIYAKALGSVVNPVLRQGNADRRLAKPVKDFARKNPHKMGEVSSDSKSYVAHMNGGDFYENEKSVTLGNDTVIKYQFVDKQGNVTELKQISLTKGDVVDGTFMSRKKLRKFYSQVIENAKDEDILFSLHVKATMMKISDPVIFGDAIRVFFAELFEKFGTELEEIGFNPNNGLSDLEKKLEKLPADKQKSIKDLISEIYDKQPRLYMVDSDRGITNLHRPNDVIIDASIPAVIKNGLKGWDREGNTDDLVITVPDRSYATMYREIVEDIKLNGQFNPAEVGTVANVGLMAMKAEEYGSHDKTWFAPADGKYQIIDADGNVLIELEVEEGDIFRSCITRNIAIKDWVKLAVNRAKESGMPIVFWLDKYRGHDKELIKIVREELKNYDLEGIEWHIKAPVDAMKYTLKRFRAGLDTIAVTGNVLRDYLTDLFPIIEVGTSARTLSIVPLIAGGGVFETGAGGSAPKHIQQLINEGHLRWDSLGEYMALVESLKLAYKQANDNRILVYADALSEAISKYLENRKTPGRKVGELDTRGSHFYLVKYWIEALAEQTENQEIAQKFKPIAEKLNQNEKKILDEIDQTQGKTQDLGGYYYLDDEKTNAVMRPSKTFNEILEQI